MMTWVRAAGCSMAAAACMGTTFNASAEPLPVATTIDELVSAALRDNPRLAAMRAEWQAMREMPAQERSLPNPMVTYRAMDTTDRFPGTDEQRYEASQTIPWAGKRDLRGRLAEKDVEQAGFAYEAMRRETVMRVRESGHELAATRNAMAIVEAEEAVLTQLAQVAEAKYAAGAASLQDATKARAEIPMLRGRWLDLQAREGILTARLNALLNRPPAAPLNVRVETLPPASTNTVDALLATAQANRPEIRQSLAKVERAEAQRALMRKERLPDVTVGVEYRQLAGMDDMAMFMVGLDLPLWFNRNAAGVREAELRLASGRAAAVAAQRETQFDVSDAWLRLRAARQTLDLYETELIPQARLRFESSEAGYRAGKVDFMDLLESERFLLNARLMRAMAEGDVGVQNARLEWASGAPSAPGESGAGSE